MKVILRFFQDDLGEWGVAPNQSIDAGFNAFWTGAVGIFHDVFEHYFEDNHRYFRGKAAHNIAGEVVAMGHLCYYVNRLAVNRQSSRGGRVYTDRIYDDTLHMMTEYIEDGYTSFGEGWVCPVPRQAKPLDYNIETAITEHLYMLEEFYTEKEIPKDKRIKLTDVESCYRWGYKQAEKLAPRNGHNIGQLNGFIDFWDKFCKAVDVEEAARIYRTIEFNITPGEKMKWNAWFIPDMAMQYDFPDMPKKVNYKRAMDYLML